MYGSLFLSENAFILFCFARFYWTWNSTDLRVITPVDMPSVTFIETITISGLRMHLSKMRTVRCSGRLMGEGVCPGYEVSAQGVSTRGVSTGGGWFLPRGFYQGVFCPGECLIRGVCPGAVSARHPPREHITLPCLAATTL